MIRFVEKYLINFWVLNLFGWSVYGFNHLYVFYHSDKFTTNYILAGSFHVISGFVFTILLRYIYSKMKLTSKSWIYTFVTVLVLSVFLAIILYITDSYSSYLIHNREIIFKEKTFLLKVYYVFYGAIMFIGWSAVYLTFKIWLLLTEQKSKLAEINSLATNAQLAALRYQLNPHFLFNALSSLRALIPIDPEKAKSMITKISEFLRYSLMSEDIREIPLEKELETVKDYLDIEKIRFGNEFNAEFKIDYLAEEYPIPPFLITPLVENAIKHGFKNQQKTLLIEVIAEVTKEQNLELRIKNSGKWIENSSNDSTYTGLKNVSKRLKMLYAGNHKFDIIKNDNSVVVVINIMRNRNE